MSGNDPDPRPIMLPPWLSRLIDNPRTTDAVVVSGFVAGGVGSFQKSDAVKWALLAVAGGCLWAARLLDRRRTNQATKREEAAAEQTKSAREAAEEAVEHLI